MGKSAILSIDELASGQTQAYSTVNDAVAALEGASNDEKSIITASDYIVAALDLVRFGVFVFSGMTADRTITLPSTINTLSVKRKFTIVNASSTYDLSVTSGSNTVVVPYGSSREIQINGTTVRIIGEAGRVFGLPHTTALFAAGLQTHDTEVLRYVFVEEVVWADEMASSRGTVGTPPSPGCAFYAYKNGTLVGRAFVTAGGTFTFTTTGTTVSWAVGDVLTVKYQALEIGTIAFSSVADTGDTVTIDDGTSAPVTFTFGGGGGQVVPGASAQDSAINLEAAINASALNTTIRVVRSTSTLTIWNLLPARGGALTKSDADNDYTITAFATDGSSENWGVTFYGTRA